MISMFSSSADSPDTVSGQSRYYPASTDKPPVFPPTADIGTLPTIQEDVKQPRTTRRSRIQQQLQQQTLQIRAPQPPQQSQPQQEMMGEGDEQY